MRVLNINTVSFYPVDLAYLILKIEIYWRFPTSTDNLYFINCGML